MASCEQCRWWVKDDLCVSYGQCRARAPMFHPKSLATQEDRPSGVWPYTAGDGWCGDFQKQKAQ